MRRILINARGGGSTAKTVFPPDRALSLFFTRSLQRFGNFLMPNPGKPLALKLLTGSRRVGKQAPGVRLQALQQAPPPPDWMVNDSARAEWNHLAPLLVANGLLTEGSLSVLAHACNMHGVITRSFAAGEHPKAATLGIYRLMVNDFGLTPATRDKVASAPASTTANRFHRNGSRPKTT